MADLNWSQAQWERINGAVQEEFAKASVAGAFLPCYGPLSGDPESVRDERVNEVNDPSGLRVVRVEDNCNIRFWKLTVNVVLSSHQVAEENLAGALLAFRRAANQLAKGEDYIVFSSFAPEDPYPPYPDPYFTGRRTALRLGLGNAMPQYLPQICSLGDDRALGLLEAGGNYSNPGNPVDTRLGLFISQGADPGSTLVRTISNAIAQLEREAHTSPFACVLGHGLYVNAHTPQVNSMVLPADRITPMLGGPLLRSNNIPQNTGFVVSLSADPFDIVVATPPTIQFMRMTLDAKYLFRVYEKFVLRIKYADDTGASPAAYTFTIL